MSTTADSQQAFHRGTAPIFAILSMEQVRQMAHLPVDSSLADRVDELAEKANEGLLTAEERAEYEAYIEANNLMAILQAEAKFRLQHGGV
jgi:predicted RNA-binding protein associated with RNAse of E/G family